MVIAIHVWVDNTAHIKLREPRNLGCASYGKELQEMVVKRCANRGCDKSRILCQAI